MAAHQLPGCPLPNEGADFTLELTALGAFRASQKDMSTVALDRDGEALEFSPETLGVEAAADDGASRFIGYTERRTSRGIDVSLWPERRSCPLFASDDDDYPGDGGGQALAWARELGVAMIAGEDADDGRAQNALTFELDTGAVHLHPGPLSTAHATLTPFADGFLLAGGEDPHTGNDARDRVRSRSAFVFHVDAREFDASPIRLLWDRTRHAALRLANGATLLVGGVTSAGLVRDLEAVFPGSDMSSFVGLAALDLGRVDPVALALDDGRIVVAGGRSELDEPVSEVEWLSSDASQHLARVALPARPDRAFVATPGGGVLSVAGCASEGTCTSGEASWIASDYVVSQVELEPSTSCPIGEHPLLVAGADEAPLLAFVYRDLHACTWRFEPWPGDDAEPAPGDDPGPEAHPRFVPDSLTLDPLPDPRVRPLALGPSALFWVAGRTAGQRVGALRLASRGALSREISPLLGADASSGRFHPAHLLPDRPLDPALPHAFDRDPVGGGGGLSLFARDAGVTFWVSNTLYDDMTLTLELASITPGGDDPRAAPPLVLLDDTALGGLGCPWPLPDGNDDPLPLATVSVVRRGTKVTLANAGKHLECSVGPGPLRLGVRRGGGDATLVALDVDRD